MMRIDEYAYRSPLRKINPKGKLIFGAAALFLCLCFSAYGVSVFITIFMAWMAVRVSRMPFKKYIKMMLIPFAFLIIGTITIMINRHPLGTELLFGADFFGFSFGISTYSLQFGILLILKCLGAVSCMYFICINTPLTDILAALHAMKVPLLIVNLMELIYRYIFVLLEEANKMKTAQDSRLGYGKLKVSLRSTGELAGTLFLRTYLKADRIYAALQSRGYEGEFQTLTPVYEPSTKWIAGAALFSGVLTLLYLAERVIL